MEALDRIFGQWTQALAPGTGDKAGVVRDRILYRSAEEKSLPEASRLVGDAMNVDLGAMHLPLADPVKQASALVAQEKPSLPDASRLVGDAMNVAPEAKQMSLADTARQASARTMEDKSLPEASHLVDDAMNMDPEARRMPVADPKKEAGAMAIEQTRPVRDAATRAVGEMDLE